MNFSLRQELPDWIYVQNFVDDVLSSEIQFSSQTSRVLSKLLVTHLKKTSSGDSEKVKNSKNQDAIKTVHLFSSSFSAMCESSSIQYSLFIGHLTGVNYVFFHLQRDILMSVGYDGNIVQWNPCLAMENRKKL
jgi:hypothetical protein